MQQIGVCPHCRGQGVQISSPCGDCKGEGRKPERVRLNVKIPAGVEHGMRLRMAGEGEAGPRGSPPGDLVLHVRVREDKRFQRRGKDLTASFPVSIAKATLGGPIEVETFDGKVDLRVPPSTQHGTRLRLQGKGMPDVRGGPAGDLYVRIQVAVPEKISDRAEELLRELADELGDPTDGKGKKKNFVEKVVDAFRE